MGFSYNFIMVFMPFYILKISPFVPRETLLWIGFILGDKSIATALFPPFWGALTARFSPKLLFERAYSAVPSPCSSWDMRITSICSSC